MGNDKLDGSVMVEQKRKRLARSTDCCPVSKGQNSECPTSFCKDMLRRVEELVVPASSRIIQKQPNGLLGNEVEGSHQYGEIRPPNKGPQEEYHATEIADLRRLRNSVKTRRWHRRPHLRGEGTVEDGLAKTAQTRRRSAEGDQSQVGGRIPDSVGSVVCTESLADLEKDIGWEIIELGLRHLYRLECLKLWSCRGQMIPQ
jgi:hypothetical protein